MKSLGIDPGNTGALAFYDGVDIVVYDMPTTTTKTGRKTKKGNDRLSTKVSVDVLAGLLRPYRSEVIACVEHVTAMPKQGVTSSFGFGRTFGAIEGVLAGLGIKYELIRPGDWKRHMGLTSDKTEAREMAMYSFPRQAKLFERAMDDGRAEAALLALYWWNRRDRLPH